MSNTPQAAESFERTGRPFADRITADGRDGWPVEAGRYRLVISRACPWASRVAVARRLLGLEEALPQAVVAPVQEEVEDTKQWAFTEATGSPGGRDPVLDIHLIREAYRARREQYPGGESVPIIVDVPSGQLVTNDFDRINLDLETEWSALHRPGAPELYPEALRDEIDSVNADVFRDVNNGVYKSGFTRNQAHYADAVATLFARLDALEVRLADHRYLVGDTITEADIRLFVTLVRFDAVYHGHFKCNVRKLIEYPALWAYSRDLYQTPGFGDTVDLVHIRQHYYIVQDSVNPSRIVAVGPDPAQWLIPHHRDKLGGRPFGDGTPPGPPPDADLVAHPVPS
ncbi:MAG: glutathione S-transferase family protein [Jatrophihabitans sp.]